jgi:hypothetical protein
MISSILSLFRAVSVTLRKNMMNVMRYLLRFITVFKATSSGHKLFRKKLKLGWRYSYPRSKKPNGWRNLDRVNSMRGHGDCQAIDGGLVKSRDKCPLLSTRVTKKIVSIKKLSEWVSSQHRNCFTVIRVRYNWTDLHLFRSRSKRTRVNNIYR